MTVLETLFHVYLWTTASSAAFILPLTETSTLHRLNADPGSSANDLRPHPPETPPPSGILEVQNAQAFFMDCADPIGKNQDECSIEVLQEDGLKSEQTATETVEGGLRYFDKETEDAFRSAGKMVGEVIVDELIKPILSPKVEKGVSTETIKGAAITGASLAFMAGQGLTVSGAAAAGAAFLAVTPGKGGKAFRVLGGAIWKSAQTAGNLYERFEVDSLLTSAAKKLVDTALRGSSKGKGNANINSNGSNRLEKMSKVLSDVEQAVAQSESDYDRVGGRFGVGGVSERDDPEGVAPKLEDALLALEIDGGKIYFDEEQEQDAGRAEAAMLAAKDKEWTQEDARAAEKEIKEQDARYKKDLEARLDEEVKLAKAEQDRQGAARVAAATRLAKTEQERQEAAKVSEERRLAKAGQVRQEAVRRAEERMIASEQVAEAAGEDVKTREEASKNHQSRPYQAVQLAEDLEDDIDMIDLEDWEASIRLVGELDETISEEEWDAAGRLSNGFVGEDGYDIALSADELAAQARSAVEMFEQMDLSSDDEEPSDLDLEEIALEVDGFEDIDASYDLEEIGKLARDAVEKFDSSFEDLAGNGAIPIEIAATDWSALTVSSLKAELKLRRLKATGRKADLISALEEYDREMTGETISSSDDGFDDLDMEAVARAARESVELFNVDAIFDSPFEEGKNFNEDDASESAMMPDLQGMTVAQLKEELRSRGLKVGGKKAELIERLLSASGVTPS